MDKSLEEVWRYSFGETFHHEEFTLVEHYDWYDRPLSYLVHHKENNLYYLVNLDSERLIDGQWVINEVYTLLTDGQLLALRASEVTIRQLVIEGLQWETFMLTTSGLAKEWTTTVSWIDEERLYREILTTAGALDFKKEVDLEDD